MKEIKRDIYEFLSSFKGGEINVGFDDSLLEGGFIDSLRMIQLVTFIEQRYGVYVEADDFIPENFDSINGIFNFICTRRSDT